MLDAYEAFLGRRRAPALPRRQRLLLGDLDLPRRARLRGGAPGPGRDAVLRGGARRVASRLDAASPAGSGGIAGGRRNALRGRGLRERGLGRPGTGVPAHRRRVRRARRLGVRGHRAGRGARRVRARDGRHRRRRDRSRRSRARHAARRLVLATLNRPQRLLPAGRRGGAGDRAGARRHRGSSDYVRSDIVLLETPSGRRRLLGRLHLLCGALSHRGYDNNISRMVGNVVREFLRSATARRIAIMWGMATTAPREPPRSPTRAGFRRQAFIDGAVRRRRVGRDLRVRQPGHAARRCSTSRPATPRTSTARSPSPGARSRPARGRGSRRASAAPSCCGWPT